MSTKTKKTVTTKDKLAQAAQQAGLVLMTAAVTLGMLELPDRASAKAIVPSQPVFEFAGNTGQYDQNNTLRREREETGPHYVSYSITQRTPGRAGKH